MNVKTNVQAGQDLRFPVMDETSGTVKPVDLDAAPLLFECGDQDYRFSAYRKALDEIERLRETVAFYVKAMRLNAGYKPEGE